MLISVHHDAGCGMDPIFSAPRSVYTGHVLRAVDPNQAAGSTGGASHPSSSLKLLQSARSTRQRTKARFLLQLSHIQTLYWISDEQER